MSLEMIFNSSLEIGQFITANAVNVTGSDTLSLVILVSVLLLIGFVFRLPEVLILLAISPFIIVLGSVDRIFWGVLGIIAIMLGSVLFIIFKK